MGWTDDKKKSTKAIGAKARAQFSSLHALGAARLQMLVKERQHLGPQVRPRQRLEMERVARALPCVPNTRS